jgi:hypothetical protein
MAEKSLSKERIAKIRERIKKLRSEKRAAVSGDVATIPAALTSYLKTYSWAAASYPAEFIVFATVVSSGQVESCSIAAGNLEGTYTYTENEYSGNGTTLVSVHAVSTANVPAAGTSIASTISGTTNNGGGTTFSYTRQLYVYEMGSNTT